MSYIVGFHCECGHGPFFVCDHRDAPIPVVVPPSIIDDNGEGEQVGSCPNCDRELPTFEYTEHGIVHYVNEMLIGKQSSDRLHQRISEEGTAAMKRLREQVERAVNWIEAHPQATSWGRRG